MVSAWKKTSASASGVGLCVSLIPQVASDELSSVCTSSLDLMTVPRLIERFPPLVKANMAVAASAAVKEHQLPSVLALYGTRQTPKKRHYGNSGTSPSAAAVDYSPDLCLRSGESKTPLRMIIGRRQENAVGYSARLKTIDRQEFPGVEEGTRGSCLSNIDESKVSETPGVYGIPPKAFRCDWPSCTYDPFIQHESQSCRPFSATEVTSPGLRDSVHKDHQQITPNSAPKYEKTRKSHGRLCKGIVASSRPYDHRNCDSGSDAIASLPRILFLVSGKGQQPDPRTRLNSTRRVSSGTGRRAIVRLVSPRDALLAPAGKAVEHRGLSSFSPRDRNSKCDSNLSTFLPQGGGSMRLDPEDVDVATEDSTAGEGENAGRWVLRVTVPRPPPTSLLILRSPPQP